VLCGLTYRYRSQVRPETLATLLLVLELWILEAGRRGGRDHAPWLVAIALAWANLHISYFMGIALQAFFLLDAWARGQALSVHGWVYALGNGLINDLDVSVSNPGEFTR
jgi:hypothetical protein